VRPLLCPTPAGKLLDGEGRPYFLWDVDLTIEELRERLGDADAEVAAYWAAKVMRQAKPDDALMLVTPQQILERWDLVRPYLGRSAPFWSWLVGRWREACVA
jgi:hypothetical protein